MARPKSMYTEVQGLPATDRTRSWRRGDLAERPARDTRPGREAWSGVSRSSPDGSRLAIGQQGIDRPDSILRIWDQSQRRDAAWFVHPAGFRSVAFSSDGKSVAAGNFDGTLTILDAANEWKVLHSENQGSPINSLLFLPKSATIAAGDWDGWVRFHGPDAMANRRPIKYPARSGPSPSARMARC